MEHDDDDDDDGDDEVIKFKQFEQYTHLSKADRVILLLLSVVTLGLEEAER